MRRNEKKPRNKPNNGNEKSSRNTSQTEFLETAFRQQTEQTIKVNEKLDERLEKFNETLAVSEARLDELLKDIPRQKRKLETLDALELEAVETEKKLERVREEFLDKTARAVLDAQIVASKNFVNEQTMMEFSDSRNVFTSEPEKPIQECDAYIHNAQAGYPHGFSFWLDKTLKHQITEPEGFISQTCEVYRTFDFLTNHVLLNGLDTSEKMEKFLERFKTEHPETARLLDSAYEWFHVWDLVERLEENESISWVLWMLVETEHPLTVDQIEFFLLLPDWTPNGFLTVQIPKLGTIANKTVFPLKFTVTNNRSFRRHKRKNGFHNNEGFQLCKIQGKYYGNQ